MPKNTADTTLAQLRPLPFAQAIHSHRPIAIRPPITGGTCGDLSGVQARRRVGRMPRLDGRLQLPDRRHSDNHGEYLRAAPAYISLTALSAERGGWICSAPAQVPRSGKA